MDGDPPCCTFAIDSRHDSYGVGGGGFQRVRQQVHQVLVHCLTMASKRGKLLGYLAHHRHRTRCDDRLQFVEDLSHEWLDGKRRQLDDNLIGLDPRNVEHVVDEGGKVATVRIDFAHHAPMLGVHRSAHVL